nr:MAG TPA: hypothetical protein [Caudoviricetes sp.]
MFKVCVCSCIMQELFILKKLYFIGKFYELIRWRCKK